MARVIVVTNNPLLKNLKEVEVCYQSTSILKVMEKARKMVCGGYQLLSHPLNGNWQMNASPYKTLIIERTGKELDSKSVLMLEKGFYWARELASSNKKPEEWPVKVQYDFQMIDEDILKNALLGL